MILIAFGVVVCALGEANLVMKGLLQQLVALGFEVGVQGRSRQRWRQWQRPRQRQGQGQKRLQTREAAAAQQPVQSRWPSLPLPLASCSCSQHSMQQGAGLHATAGSPHHYRTQPVCSSPPCPLSPGRCCCPLLQAARLTLVQILMNAKGLAMNPLQSLYYVSPACLLCLAVPFRESALVGLRCAALRYACWVALPCAMVSCHSHYSARTA